MCADQAPAVIYEQEIEFKWVVQKNLVENKAVC